MFQVSEITASGLPRSAGIGHFLDLGHQVVHLSLLDGVHLDTQIYRQIDRKIDRQLDRQINISAIITILTVTFGLLRIWAWSFLTSLILVSILLARSRVSSTSLKNSFMCPSRQIDRQIDRWIDRQIDRQMDRQIYRQIDREIDIQIDREIDIQIGRWID